MFLDLAYDANSPFLLNSDTSYHALDHHRALGAR